MPSADTLPQDDDFELYELAAWSAPDLDRVLEQNGLPAATPIGHAGTIADDGHLLRISPTTAWLICARGRPAPSQSAAGVVVDLSSSRLRLRLRDAWAEAFPPLVPVDCTQFGPAFAATSIHGMPVTIVKVDRGFDVFVVRSFAASLAGWLAVKTA